MIDKNNSNQIKNNMKRQQIQKQEQLTAYNRKTTHDIFFMTMEWLEKYIEIAGYYPDWENRKQIQNNNVKRKDIIGNPKKTEQDFLTQLFLFWGTLKRNLPFSDELKAEFYQWLNAAKIDNNNCPIRLKHLLYGFNEVLEGRGEKLQEDIENMEEELDSNSPEYMEQMGKIFVNIQAPLRDEAEVEKSLSGKTHKDIKIEKKFGGDSEVGKKSFGQLTEEVSNNDFNFFPQKGQQQRSNSEIIQDVKNNPQNWRIDEIITSYEFGKAKEESLLLYRTAEIDYDVMGNLKFDSQPIYRASRFNQAEITEIKRAKNISENDENRQLIEEIKNSRNSWKIENLQGQDWLVNNRAQKVQDEVGNLLHSKQRFTDGEWTEIESALNNQQSWVSPAVSNVLPTNYGNKQNYKLGVVTNQIAVKQPPKDNKFGTIATISIFSILVIGGALVAKNKLNKKVKK